MRRRSADPAPPIIAITRLTDQRVGPIGPGHIQRLNREEVSELLICSISMLHRLAVGASEHAGSGLRERLSDQGANGRGGNFGAAYLLSPAAMTDEDRTHQTSLRRLAAVPGNLAIANCIKGQSTTTSAAQVRVDFLRLCTASSDRMPSSASRSCRLEALGTNQRD
jgi:hypothetical protein